MKSFSLSRSGRVAEWRRPCTSVGKLAAAGTLLLPTEVTRKVSEQKSKAQEPRCTDVRFEDLSLCPHYCTVAVSVTPASRCSEINFVERLGEDYS